MNTTRALPFEHRGRSGTVESDVPAVAFTGNFAESHENDDENAEGKPVFLGRGAVEQVIPPERVERVAEILEDGGADGRFETSEVGHGTTPAEIPDVLAWLEPSY